MPLHPPPTIQNHLGLITQPITRLDTSHVAQVTFAVDVGGGLTALQAVTAFQTAFNTTMTVQLDTDCTAQKPTILLGDGTNAPAEATAANAAIPGSNADAILPSNVSVLFKKRTGFAGKHNRGRTYFPWMVANSLVTEVGGISPAEVTALQTAGSAFLAALLAAQVPMVIANKTLVTTPPDTKPHVTHIGGSTAVTAYLVESTIATQRRRLRG